MNKVKISTNTQKNIKKYQKKITKMKNIITEPKIKQLGLRIDQTKLKKGSVNSKTKQWNLSHSKLLEKEKEC